MLALERIAGKAAPNINTAAMPRGCQMLWDTFIELHNKRTSGMGPSPIGWRDLQAWQALRQVTLTPWEIDTLLALDTAALKSHQETTK